MINAIYIRVVIHVYVLYRTVTT